MKEKIAVCAVAKDAEMCIRDRLYARQTCERYDNYVSDDKTKDLINLQEKAISIAMYEQYGVTIHKDILDAYVVDENLTGVVVTDKAGNCVLSSGEDAQILFEKELKNDSVSQILEHPEKSYMERLQIGEKMCIRDRSDDAPFYQG